MSGRFYVPEIMAPGVALFDYDADGDLDVYLVQGQALEPGGPRTPARREAPLSDRLYRNDLRVGPDGGPWLGFTDVTASAGLDPRGYGMGMAAGDVNNDGWVDLYLTRFGAPNQLLINQRDGSFADRARAAGVDDLAWGVSASFVDVDRDGWLDLFVGNYLQYDLASATPCVAASGAPGYCTPDAYSALPDRLYRNRGDGTFEDISDVSGIARAYGPALGVVAADFDGDGWPDLYVANDGAEDQLWRNGHDGTFEDRALLAGVARPVTGVPEGSMGVDAGDVDDDGDEDLFITELAGEGSNLFVNDGTGTFEDRSAPSGLALASLRFTGFGTGWLDYDSDGWLDLLSVNGTVQIIEALRQAGDPMPLHQRRLLLRNRGDLRFDDVTTAAGASFQTSEVGRGAAFGDVDNDGDVDVLIGHNNGPVRLFLNRTTGSHWLGLRLLASGRDALGARVEIVQAGVSRWRRSRADGSYASASDPRVLVGLGRAGDAVDVRVRWPDGSMERWVNLPVDRYVTLTQGSGS